MLAALAVVAFAIAAGTVVDLLRVRTAIESGQARLDDLTIDDIRDEGIDTILTAAAGDLAQASSLADSSPFLSIWAPVPVLGDQVDALRDMAAAADRLGEEAGTTGIRVSEAIDAAGSRPEARIEMLEVVASELLRIERLTASIEIGAEGDLLPPVRAARESLAESLAEVPDRLAPLKQQVASLRDLLAGPTDYLVTVGNNAEMRAGTAMPLQIGRATFDRGDISLTDFLAATSFLFTPNPSGEFNADIDQDLRDTYPRWLIGYDFPETAVVPDFTRTGPIYADIADDTQGWRTQGVLHIDAIALAELLEAVGPIVVDGVEYNSETAPQLVLNQTYIDYNDVHRSLRRDAQSELANKLFEAIEERDVDLLDIVAALQRAAEGRHLMAWSRDPVLQDMFESLDVDGGVESFETLVSVQNTAANKLDWYIDPSVEVTTERADDDHWRVNIETTVQHPDRELGVTYIDGPYWDDGRHRMLLTTQVPAEATQLTMPDEQVSEYGFDGTSWVIGTRFELPVGETRTVTTSYLLPRETPGMRVVPSARVEPVPWTLNGVPFDDATVTEVGFGPFPREQDDGWVPFALAGVVVAAAGAAVVTMGARRPSSQDGAARLTRLDNLTGAALLLMGFALVAASNLLG